MRVRKEMKEKEQEGGYVSRFWGECFGKFCWPIFDLIVKVYTVLVKGEGSRILLGAF